MRPIVGANLGNWLVLEKWMLPRLFEGTAAEDETWLARDLAPEAFRARLTAHRDSFITRRDFEAMAAHGVNVARLPVPFFVFGDRPPFIGCVEYVDRALDWAEATGVGVLLDLHTVPGSQNGYDNGGLTGVCKWRRDEAAVDFALSVLERLARRYGHRPGLFGIEVLNEPVGLLAWLSAPGRGKARDPEEARGSGHVPMGFLKDYYRRAYRLLRPLMAPDKAIVFHDGFRFSRWGRFFRRAGMENVLLDTHIYLFPVDRVLPLGGAWRYRAFIALQRWRIRRMSRSVPVVVGEWCAGNGWAWKSPKGIGDEEARALRRRRFGEVFRMQADAWSVSAGHIFWSLRIFPPDESMPEDDWRESWDLTQCWKFI